jgi:hypothetical protein
LPGAAGKGEGAGDESLSGPLAHPNNLLKEAAFLSPDAHLAKWQKAINAGSIHTLPQDITHEAWRRFDEEFWRFFTDASGSQVPFTFENQSDPAARVIPPAALRMALLKGTHGVKAKEGDQHRSYGDPATNVLRCHVSTRSGRRSHCIPAGLVIL